MTLLSPHYLSIDTEPLATYAKGLEVVDGIEVIPSRRIREQAGAYQDGSFPSLSTPSFFNHKTQRIRIWVAATDADGLITHSTGPAGHLRENIETLYRILGGKAISAHVVDWIVPTTTGTKTLRANGRISAEIPSTGSTRMVRRIPITIDYPWPFFQDITTGQITLGPFTGAQSFTPGGTAPLAGAVYTCTAAGRITHDETGDFIEVTSIPGGATSVIIDTVPPRTVQTNTAVDARAVYNSNRPWPLRFDAGVLANLTITGTWSIAYYDLHH